MLSHLRAITIERAKKRKALTKTDEINGEKRLRVITLCGVIENNLKMHQKIRSNNSHSAVHQIFLFNLGINFVVEKPLFNVSNKNFLMNNLNISLTYIYSKLKF